MYKRQILLSSIEECIEFSNEYAPEHLILSIENPENILSQITNAGSIFLGNYTPESAGAVSYTHLDVYKRQALCIIVKNKI